MLNQPHGCPDWDFMWIKPGDPEMECCTCEDLPPPSGGVKWGSHAVIQKFDGHSWKTTGQRIWRDGQWHDMEKGP